MWLRDSMCAASSSDGVIGLGDEPAVCCCGVVTACDGLRCCLALAGRRWTGVGRSSVCAKPPELLLPSLALSLSLPPNWELSSPDTGGGTTTWIAGLGGGGAAAASSAWKAANTLPVSTDKRRGEPGSTVIAGRGA